MNVHATLTFGQPLPYTFELIQEDGRWAIDRIVLPPSPATPTDVPGSDTGGGIYYVAPGGETIMRVQPDGSGMEEAYTGIAQSLGGPLTYLGPVPGNPMQIIVAGAGTHYAAISGGVSIDMGAFAAPPRWSADGWRAVGAAPTDTGLAGAIAMFDLRSRQRSELPISGQPDWFPDGQRLVYVRCGPEEEDKGCNVWTYDLASGASAQISTLVSTAGDRWYVQEAHVLPDGNTVIFYGNHTTEVGASGNGLQWWAIPASGGDAQLFSESYGNGVNDFQFSPDGAQLSVTHDTNIYVGTAQNPLFSLLDLGGLTARYPAWSPDGTRLALATRKGSEPWRLAIYDLNSSQLSFPNAPPNIGGLAWALGQRLAFA
ncbi:hypothetical protein SE17_12910, partial [Kouleothrix aurantiaca]